MRRMGLGLRVRNGVARTVGALLVGATLVAGAEVETVAYYVDRARYAEIVDGWGLGGEDPFSEVRGEVQAVEQPFLIKTPPGKTRFLKTGDRMWVVTKHLWQAGVFEEDASWAVWNEDGNRLVVRGTLWEQVLAERICRSLDSPALVGTEWELLRVPCREFGVVPWTAAEVRKRGGVSLGTMAMTGRPGQKAFNELAMPGGMGSLEVDAFLGADDYIVDGKVRYSVPVRHPDGVRRLELETALAVFGGHEVFYELGGADDAATTYVLRVKGVPRFIDGTPRWRWRETEDEVLTKAPTVPEYYAMVWTELEGGWVLGRVAVHPTFVEDIAGNDGGADIDPFAPDAGLGGRDEPRWNFPRVDPPDDVAGFQKSDVVFDVSEVLKDAGVGIPEGGWIYFNRTKSSLVAKLDASNLDLLEALVCGVLYDPPRLIRTTVSVIEWQGELEPGRMPIGARRVARAGMVSRPGQKVSLRHGWPTEELKRGVELKMEVNIGANSRILDFKIDGKVAGESPVSFSTALTAIDADPVLVPLNAVEGKKRGVVVECRVIDATGREVRE